MRSYIKHLIISVALLSALSSWAQPVRRWGVTVGGNYNEIHFKQTDIFESDQWDLASTALSSTRCVRDACTWATREFGNHRA